MKSVLVLAATVLVAGPALAADVGVSISIGDPDFYGQLVITDAPPPVVINREPVYIVRPQVVVEPVYLRVRPEHTGNWAQYCGQYNACDRPVYFVKDEYYREVYVPHYQKRHGKGKGKQKQGKGN